jgi:hypothetical protein
LRHSEAQTNEARKIWRNGTTGLAAIQLASTNMFVTNASSRCLYDNAGTLTAVGNNNYWSLWMYVSDIHGRSPVYIIVGRTSGALSTVQAERPPALESIAPAAEGKLLYQLIFRNVSGEPSYIQTVDYRATKVSIVGAVTESDPFFKSASNNFMTVSAMYDPQDIVSTPSNVLSSAYFSYRLTVTNTTTLYPPHIGVDTNRAASFRVAVLVGTNTFSLGTNVLLIGTNETFGSGVTTFLTRMPTNRFASMLFDRENGTNTYRVFPLNF